MGLSIFTTSTAYCPSKKVIDQVCRYAAGMSCFCPTSSAAALQTINGDNEVRSLKHLDQPAH
jgi:hypothetical protein